MSPLIHILEGKFNPVAGRLRGDFLDVANPLHTPKRLESLVRWKVARAEVHKADIDAILLVR